MQRIVCMTQSIEAGQVWTFIDPDDNTTCFHIINSGDAIDKVKLTEVVFSSDGKFLYTRECGQYTNVEHGIAAWFFMRPHPTLVTDCNEIKKVKLFLL